MKMLTKRGPQIEHVAQMGLNRRGCSKTSSFGTATLKNAVPQGFSLRNCRSQRLKPVKTNRVLKQALSRWFPNMDVAACFISDV
jgi:hypothetical protein